MKKTFFIALSALLILMTSCTNDAEISTSTLKSEQVNNDLSLMNKVGDTLFDSETGGQGGHVPPTKP